MMKIVSKIIFIMIIVILWQFIITIFSVPSYFFPSASVVFNAMKLNYNTILSNASLTLIESLIGFSIANILSIIIALYLAFNREFEDYIMPFAVLLKTIPILAITPLLVLWFGSGIESKAATAGLICFFPSLVNVLRGAKSLDSDMIELFKLYSATKIQLIKFLIFPSILPYLFSALKVSSSLAIVGALVGEFIGANQGLGFLIITNYYNLNIAMVFATIITSSLIGIAFYYIINFIEIKTVRWTDLNGI